MVRNERSAVDSVHFEKPHLRVVEQLLLLPQTSLAAGPAWLMHISGRVPSVMLTKLITPSAVS